MHGITRVTGSNLATPTVITETKNLNKKCSRPHAWDELILKAGEQKFIIAIYCDMGLKDRIVKSEENVIAR
jgi:hypothetical protein